MKNIAFVIHSLGSGGAERVVSVLANKLSNTYNVTIITFTKSDPFYPIHENVKVLHCLDEIPPSKNILQALKLNVILFRKISSLTKDLSLHVLIGFMTQANVLSVLVSKRRRIPAIISERNNPKKDITPKFWRLLRKFVYPLTNILVVQTRPIAKFYESSVSQEKIKILENPISSSYSKLRKDSNFIERENIVLNVGRLAEQKGQEIVIKAFADLNAKNWRLLIAGQGPKIDEYQCLIDSLGMNENIELLGNVKNIGSYYLKSSIFVFPSRYEGFPNALTEAMYFGLPCISSDCPTGPSELIKNGENGYLVPVDSIDQFKTKLEELINDEKLRCSFGCNAQNSVAHLEEGIIAKSWQNMIEKIT